MTRKIIYTLLSLCLISGGPINALAGGRLETIDLTGNRPSPLPGQILARVIGIKWDTRAIPVQYSINTTLDPIPNPLGAPVLSLAEAKTAFQTAFDAWNSIPTSFIDMRITGTTDNPGTRGFDFVNELTFTTDASFAAIASSPSTSLVEDTVFEDGMDIDEDGDSDVSAAIKTVTDFDGDGDMEFPAGFYQAGTILDNDVEFNTKTTGGLRFTVGDGAVDTERFSVDLLAVATHEFGHSHGLSHSMENQLSVKDATAATMFPFINTMDKASEIAARSLAPDDIAWSSYTYPEGRESSGPGAIQTGDIPFNFKYGLITGELRHGVLNQPVAGGSLAAINSTTGERTVSSFSGTTQLSFDPATGELSTTDDPAIDIPTGAYLIPVPRGSYIVAVEAVDGSPVPAGSVSYTALIGTIYGQQNFVEEYYNGIREGARELDLGESIPLQVVPGFSNGNINLITSDSTAIENFGALTSVGLVNQAPGFLYAVQIPASQILKGGLASDLLIQGVSCHTHPVDSSVAPIFAKIALTTGVINPDGSATIDLVKPLEQQERFIGQDRDRAPFYFKDSAALGQRVQQGILNGSIQNLFIVLQIPTTAPFPGSSGQPPLIGMSNTGPIPSMSFTSADGGVTWSRQATANFMFSLVTSLQPPTLPRP